MSTPGPRGAVSTPQKRVTLFTVKLVKLPVLIIRTDGSVCVPTQKAVGLRPYGENPGLKPDRKSLSVYYRGGTVLVRKEERNAPIEQIGQMLAKKLFQTAVRHSEALLVAVEDAEKELCQNQYRSLEQPKSKTTIETLCIFVHFLNRAAFLQLDSDKRGVLMDSTIRGLAIITRQDERFFSLYNETEKAYGRCKYIWKEEAAGESLLWVMGKRLANAVGHAQDVAFITTTASYMAEIMPEALTTYTKLCRDLRPLL